MARFCMKRRRNGPFLHEKEEKWPIPVLKGRDMAHSRLKRERYGPFWHEKEEKWPILA